MEPQTHIYIFFCLSTFHFIFEINVTVFFSFARDASHRFVVSFWWKSSTTFDFTIKINFKIRYKVRYKKFKQTSIVFEKPDIFKGNLKILTSSNYHTVQSFLLKLRIGFLLTNVCKRVCGIFLFCLDLELLPKKLKIPGFCTLVFYIFINNPRTKQNKKS